MTVEYDLPIRLFAPISNRFESCDPILPPFTNLPSKLIVTALFGRFNKVIPRYRTEGVSIQSHRQLNVPRLSYGSTATVISPDIEKKEVNFDANTFLLELKCLNQSN